MHKMETWVREAAFLHWFLNFFLETVADSTSRFRVVIKMCQARRGIDFIYLEIDIKNQEYIKKLDSQPIFFHVI